MELVIEVLQPAGTKWHLLPFFSGEAFVPRLGKDLLPKYTSPVFGLCPCPALLYLKFIEFPSKLAELCWWVK